MAREKKRNHPRVHPKRRTTSRIPRLRRRNHKREKTHVQKRTMRSIRSRRFGWCDTTKVENQAKKVTMANPTTHGKIPKPRTKTRILEAQEKRKRKKRKKRKKTCLVPWTCGDGGSTENGGTKPEETSPHRPKKKKKKKGTIWKESNSYGHARKTPPTTSSACPWKANREMRDRKRRAKAAEAAAMTSKPMGSHQTQPCCVGLPLDNCSWRILSWAPCPPKMRARQKRNLSG
mmetsp:Transcript_6362/g.39691  ORF Transcript_6362/g.39691 Transcript_6362/m.39691 type:complete len:232 (-) Transcript_6362:2429-3124(-)